MMREEPPLPTERMKALSALKACTSRNSSSPRPGGETSSQVAPPSAVRITVPPEPLTQQTASDTALQPRNLFGNSQTTL